MTKNPRLMISVPPHVKRTVERVAVVQGKSQSAVVAEILEELEPGLLRVAMLGELLRDMTQSQRESLRAGVEAAEEDVARAIGASLEALGMFDGAVSGALDGALGDDWDDDRPPSSNTGVR